MLTPFYNYLGPPLTNMHGVQHVTPGGTIGTAYGKKGTFCGHMAEHHSIKWPPFLFNVLIF